MKGVIVQIGEPKSIVLFNNGKIRAIPTPADCHVGMVVTVKLNNRLKIIGFTLAAVFLLTSGVFIGMGFHKNRIVIPVLAAPQTQTRERGALYSGGEAPGTVKRGRQSEAASVSEAKNFPDDTRVLLTGNIVQSLGKEKYLFRDASGEITVEIDRKLWRDLSVGASDTVELSGEVDVEKGQVVIEVKGIRKI